MTNSALLYEQSGPVGWINLNRPNEMNAINLQMLDEFEEILPRIANDDAVKVIVGRTGLPKRTIYQLALKMSNATSPD